MNTDNNYLIPLFMLFFTFSSLYLKKNSTDIDSINKIIHNFFMYFTPSIYNDFFDNNEDNFIEDKPLEKIELLYEEKYLEKFNKMNNEYFFLKKKKI